MVSLQPQISLVHCGQWVYASLQSRHYVLVQYKHCFSTRLTLCLARSTKQTLLLRKYSRNYPRKIMMLPELFVCRFGTRKAINPVRGHPSCSSSLRCYRTDCHQESQIMGLTLGNVALSSWPYRLSFQFVECTLGTYCIAIIVSLCLSIHVVRAGRTHGGLLMLAITDPLRPARRPKYNSAKVATPGVRHSSSTF